MRLFLVADTAQRWRKKRLNYWVISDPIYCRQISQFDPICMISDYLPALPETSHRLLLTICFVLFPFSFCSRNNCWLQTEKSRGEQRKGKEEQKKNTRSQEVQQQAAVAQLLASLLKVAVSTCGDAIANGRLIPTRTFSFLFFLDLWIISNWGCTKSLIGIVLHQSFRDNSKCHAATEPSHANLTQQSSRLINDKCLQQWPQCSKVSSAKPTVSLKWKFHMDGVRMNILKINFWMYLS